MDTCMRCIFVEPEATNNIFSLVPHTDPEVTHNLSPLVAFSGCSDFCDYSVDLTAMLET